MFGYRYSDNKKTDATERSIAIYARVSSRKQLIHRGHQEEELVTECEQRFPGRELLRFNDVGSGLNFKRQGLRTLLDAVMQRRIEVVMVAFKDRLCRFGFELVEWILEKFNTKLVVLHSQTVGTNESLAEDLLAVVTVFSARAHGMRSYKRAIEQELEGGSSIGGEKNKRKRNKKEEAGRRESGKKGKNGEGSEHRPPRKARKSGGESEGTIVEITAERRERRKETADVIG
jgi:predicted site-specific integrase-resolvase